MQKHLKKPNKFNFVIIIFIITLLISSCELLPQPVADEFDRAVQDFVDEWKAEFGLWVDEQIQGMKQELADSFDEYWQELKQDIAKNLSEFWSQTLLSINEGLGRVAPADVGKVSISIYPETEKSIIETAFKETYVNLGGESSIGLPVDVVNYWDRDTSNLLVQNFEGGSEQRSVIVLEDGTEKAYVISGYWLVNYEALGGPEIAGVPSTNPETWNINPILEFWINWGRGKRQLFNVNGLDFAMMKPRGLEFVYVVPPELWKFYKTNAYSEIGYPMGSYPLDDRAWISDDNISEETRQILDYWNDFPYRLQIFEKGSILFDSNLSQFEKLTFTPLFGSPEELRTSRFMSDVGTILINEFENGNGSLKPDSCFYSTLQHAGNMARSDGFQTVISEIAKLSLESALSGSNLVAESAYSKITLLAAEMVLEMTGEKSWSDAIKQVIAGNIIDSLYAKGIGEILSKPATQVTLILVEEEYNRIMSDRFQRGLMTTPGITAPLVSFTTTMTVRLSIVYDPITNAVSGVMTSEECAPIGYSFYFLFDPGGFDGSGTIKPDTNKIWNGRVHYMDLSNGDEIIISP